MLSSISFIMLDIILSQCQTYKLHTAASRKISKTVNQRRLLQGFTFSRDHQQQESEECTSKIRSILLLRSTCTRLSESFDIEPHLSQQNLLQCSELLKTSKMGQLHLPTNRNSNKTKLCRDNVKKCTLFARRKMGQRMIPDNTSDDMGIVIKSSSLMIKYTLRYQLLYMSEIYMQTVQKGAIYLLLIRSSVLKLLMTWFQTKTNLAILFFWPSDPCEKDWMTSLCET